MSRELPNRVAAAKAQILEAATAEFSAYGIAGARIEQIARQAGCSTSLIYVYFSNKETLFDAVLKRKLAVVREGLMSPADDLSGYAAKVFDCAMANPEVMRLMAWHNLDGETGPADERQATWDWGLADLQTAQGEGRHGDAFSTPFLLTAALALATAWARANPFSRSLDPVGPQHQQELKQHIVAAVRLLAEARKD